MLTDMMKDPLQMARLISVVDSLEDLSGRVSEAGDISAEDIERLTDLVDHLKDFRPGSD